MRINTNNAKRLIIPDGTEVQTKVVEVMTEKDGKPITSKSGFPMMVVDLEVQKGEYVGVKIREWLLLDGDKPGSTAKTVRFLKACGVNISEADMERTDFEFDENKLLDKKLTIIAQSGEYNGEATNGVKSYLLPE